MRQKEKSELTRRRIISAAIEEFGSYDYGTASINSICERGGLSKGLIYHHFKGKEELYLTCVEEVFSKIADVSKNCAEACSASGEELLLKCFEARGRLFEENPHYGALFRHASAMPPACLAAEVEIRRAGLNRINLELLKRVTQNMELRKDLSWNEVEKVYLVYQEMVNMKLEQLVQSQDLAQQEVMRLRWIKVFLYGIVKR